MLRVSSIDEEKVCHDRGGKGGAAGVAENRSSIDAGRSKTAMGYVRVSLAIESGPRERRGGGHCMHLMRCLGVPGILGDCGARKTRRGYSSFASCNRQTALEVVVKELDLPAHVSDASCFLLFSCVLNIHLVCGVMIVCLYTVKRGRQTCVICVASWCSIPRCDPRDKNHYVASCPLSRR